jgi:hypothetical protein
MGSPDLTREKFTGGPTECVGARGLRWQGVRACCDIEHKDRRWQRIEIEYLTLPGSNVVALRTRRTNRTDARTSTYGGVAVWTQAGGTRENSVVHWERDGARRQRRRGEFSAEGQSGSWAAVENPATGDTLVLIAADLRAHTYFEDFGKEGPHLMSSGHIGFEPNETKETLSWLVLCSDVRQIEAYGAALSRARQLP